MSEAPTADRARLDDDSLRSAFGFDADDEGWLSVVRKATQAVIAENAELFRRLAK